SCTPWLIEQMSLIQPEVVVTLGNFATKFVLQTQTGITRMRGSVYPWHGRKVIPTFHPAAVLRGGGEKGRQFGELQADFALITRTTTDPAPPPGQAPAPPLVELERAAEAQPPVADDQLELFCPHRSCSRRRPPTTRVPRAPPSHRSSRRATSSSSPVSS